MTHWDLIHQDARQLKARSAQDWNHTNSILHEHALEGLVYSRWQEKLPFHAARLLEIEWRLQAQRNLAYFAELAALGAECRKFGIEPALLKGAALIGDIYEDIGARSMADVDLLVPPGKMEEVAAILRARGYEDVETNKWEANEFKSVLARKWQGIELVFELHSRLFFGEEAVEWNFVPADEPEFKKLASEDMLVHLMGHLGYQHTFLHLTWLVDIDLYIRKHSFNWTRVMDLCEKLGQRRSALATLWACHDFLATPVPASLIQESWKSVLSSSFLWMPKKHPVRYYLIKHLMKDDWREAVKYDLLWLRRRAWK